ncbi:MAG TPA: hypothetical protein VFS95_07885, partial [Telluria sp.]|nr:hypothetical protein [Telluria sp.]
KTVLRPHFMKTVLRPHFMKTVLRPHFMSPFFARPHFFASPFFRFIASSNDSARNEKTSRSWSLLARQE